MSVTPKSVGMTRSRRWSTYRPNPMVSVLTQEFAGKAQGGARGPLGGTLGSDVVIRGADLYRTDWECRSADRDGRRTGSLGTCPAAPPAGAVPVLRWRKSCDRS